MDLELNEFYWDTRNFRVVFPYSRDGDVIDVRTSNGSIPYSIQEIVFFKQVLSHPRSFASFLRQDALFIESELEKQGK